jgi:16S rRNA processing protein RimM
MKEHKYIQLGTCFKPHGIKGEFIFNLFNAEESTLKKNQSIVLRPQGPTSSLSTEGKSFKIESIRFGNKVIVRLEGIADRNIVEDIIPFSIWVQRSTMQQPVEGEFYLNDLLKLEVFENDKLVGLVESFYDNGAQTVLVISLVKGGELELPFVDQFFPVVDIEGKRIEMNNPGEF